MSTISKPDDQLTFASAGELDTLPIPLTRIWRPWRKPMPRSANFIRRPNTVASRSQWTVPLIPSARCGSIGRRKSPKTTFGPCSTRLEPNTRPQMKPQRRPKPSAKGSLKSNGQQKPRNASASAKRERFKRMADEERQIRAGAVNKIAAALHCTKRQSPEPLHRDEYHRNAPSNCKIVAGSASYYVLKDRAKPGRTPNLPATSCGPVPRAVHSATSPETPTGGAVCGRARCAVPRDRKLTALASVQSARATKGWIAR